MIDDLKSLEASLLSDKESFLGDIRDLSTEELAISGGGCHGKGGSGSSGGRGKGGYGKGGSGSSGSGYGYGYGYGYHH